MFKKPIPIAFAASFFYSSIQTEVKDIMSCEVICNNTSIHMQSWVVVGQCMSRVLPYSFKS